MTWLRYYYQAAIQAMAIIALFLGGLALWLIPAAVFALNGVADEVVPNYDGVDRTMPFEDGPLYLSSALIVVVLVLWVGMVALSFGTLATSAAFLAGFVEAQPYWALIGGAFGVGMLIAAVANVAHEFCHRLDRPFHRFLGQLFFAPALHPSLPIEHVFGHHRNVGTHEDPATARRGEGFWRYFVRSVSGTFINAHRFERRRLRKEGPLGRVIFNRTFQGYGVLTGWMLAAFALGGLPGLLAFLIVAAIGLVIVELFQYISHYGLVRVPGTPVRADHSWEWSRAATSSFMLNLPRHCAHHLNGTKSYWALNVTAQAPTYPLGPNLMAFAALLPPLFHHLARSSLEDWDRRFATAAERAYATGGLQPTLPTGGHVESRS
ncbi:MAG: fatty acid desaturase [Hyphomicrobiales bacterium]